LPLELGLGQPEQVDREVVQHQLESELGHELIDEGGNPDRQAWGLRYDRATALGLEDRVVSDAGSGRGSRI